MEYILKSLCAIVLFIVSMYGWGHLVNAVCYKKNLSGWAYPAALGMGAMILTGGVLNLLDFAYAMVLLGLLLVGVGIAGYFFAQWHLRPTSNESVGMISPGRLLLASGYGAAENLLFIFFLFLIVVFHVVTVMPAQSFNFHDDFHQYLVYPVRMLQIGTLGGNPFDNIGLTFLGSQAFMQGFLLLLTGTADANAFDAIICSIIAAGLLFELGGRLRIHISFALLALLIFWSINPHYANVASLYSGTMILLALVQANSMLTAACESSEAKEIILSLFPCALFYVALFSLKTTYVFAASLFFAANLGYLLVISANKRRLVNAYLATLLMSLVMVLPWILIYSDQFLQELHNISGGRSAGVELASANVETIVTGAVTQEKGEAIKMLLSNSELFYGNTYRDYLLIVLILAGAGVIAPFIARLCKDRQFEVGLAPVITMSWVGVINYLVLIRFFEPRLVVRYSCPIFLAALPLVVIIAGAFWTDRGTIPRAGLLRYGPMKIFGIGCIVLQLAVAGAFADTFIMRIRRAYNYRTLISFPLALYDYYIEYNQFVLTGGGKAKVRLIQNQIPSGEKFLAWISMPLHLDFVRNPIFFTSEYGLSSPWLSMPFSGSRSDWRGYFTQQGIRYIMWNYKGFGMKKWEKLGKTPRQFIKALDELAQHSRIVANDGEIVVFDVREESG